MLRNMDTAKIVIDKISVKLKSLPKYHIQIHSFKRFYPRGLKKKKRILSTDLKNYFLNKRTKEMMLSQQLWTLLVIHGEQSKISKPNWRTNHIFREED
jgi:hypothetical protein